MKKAIAVCMLIGSVFSVAALAQDDVTPLDVRDVENPARHPFVVDENLRFRPGDFTVFRDIGAVPSGRRAVIEFITMQCGVESPGTIETVEFFFRSESLNGFPHYFLPIFRQGDPGDNISQSWVTAQLVRIYADEGKISVFVSRSKAGTSPNSNCEVSISGHLIAP